MLRCSWALCLALPLVSACDGWEVFPSDDVPLGPDPYVFSLLSREICPLAEGLDPRQVAILSYNVRLRGAHPQKVPANYFYASLLTTDGSRYLADFPGCGPLLSGPPLGPGETAQGYLNFPVPPGKTPEKLVYSPLLTGKPQGAPVVELLLNQSPASDIETP